MARPRRIEIGERAMDGWTLKSYVWEDVDSGLTIGYNHHYQRTAPSGFVEFMRLDLHKRGELSEDWPHIHIRLESRPVPRLDESVEMFRDVASEIPRIERLIR